MLGNAPTPLGQRHAACVIIQTDNNIEVISKCAADWYHFLLLQTVTRQYVIQHRPFSEFNAVDKHRISIWLKPRLLDLVHSFHDQNLVHGDL